MIYKLIYFFMCNGVPLFANNKKALIGFGSNSHSTACEKLKIKEDEWRKYEYLWWRKELVDEHYDSVAEKIVSHIDKSKSDLLVKALIKKELSSPFQIYKWLKDVKEEWYHLKEMTDRKDKDYLFKKLTGFTPEENNKELVKAKKRADKVIEEVKQIKWFKPEPILNKKEIKLNVKFALNLFKLPSFEIDFRWLENSNDMVAARDAARVAAGDAAWVAARVAARDAARVAAWDAAGDAAWDAAGEIAANLKSYKRLYKEVPFKYLLKLWKMGLYPIGVVNKKFVIYVPLVNGKKPKII